MPDGTSIVYLPFIHSQEFWRVDLASGRQTQIAHLENRGALRTFDITPDGKFLVFDRSRLNSNVVLIERAARHQRPLTSISFAHGTHRRSVFVIHLFYAPFI